MKVLWILIISLGAITLLGVIVFIAIFGRMIFIDKFAEASTRRMKDLVIEDPAFQVIELKHSLPPGPYEYKPSSGDVPAARDILLTPEKDLEEGQRVFDSDPSRTVLLLESSNDQPDKVFDGNNVFANDNQHLGNQLHSFDEPPLQTLRYVGGINSEWFLLAGDAEANPYANSKLWQVSHATYARKLLTEDPYFPFNRPPRVFLPEGFMGVVLVYYTGSVDFGFGGDSSRPKYSVIRLYTEDYPSGHDVARFSFRAGTIIDVKYVDDFLILYGDPSRPSSKKRLPPRLWRIEKGT